MNTATITPNYFSVSPILFSAVEKTVASGLLNEISRAASKIKSEKIKTIEEQLLTLSPYDKLTCLKKHFRNYKDKASQYPGLNFNSTDPFDPNYYTHRINSVVKDRLRKFNLTLNLFRRKNKNQNNQTMNTATITP